ncbi:MAG: bifunctional 5,10-methylenetetrahydrofolate dehydrogenase/5,10-methenyltetrahydrofolate cyclohydrolase [Candidatus Hadarchaeia archaeon]
MKELDGEKLAKKIRKNLRKRLKETEIRPRLATVLIGENPASQKYVELKERDCKEIGIEFKTHHVPSEANQKDVEELISDLNEDENFDGILVQLPLPEHLEEKEVIEKIAPEKDVDGLTSYNIGRLWADRYDFARDMLPCTPKGVVRLLEEYSIEIAGKEAAIVNRSNLVGKPIAKLLLDRNATVSICHSQTKNLKRYTKSADILITAVGARPEFTIEKQMVKKGAVVVDVGMNYLEDGLYGDVKFNEVKNKTSYITPVPGGVGPMTRVMLLENVTLAGGIKP